MYADIKLHTGENVVVDNLTKIVRTTSNGLEEIVEFNNFIFYSNVHYSFQGDNIFVVNGKDILTIKFCKN